MTVNRSTDDTLSPYTRHMQAFGMLDKQTEAELCRRYRDHRDPDALARLVGSHQRLVVKIAIAFRGYGLPVNDLVSEGNIGLIRAVTKFDPERGFRLSTYAMWWIRAAITDYVMRSNSLVKTVTTETHKKLFFNLRRLKAKYQNPDETQLSPHSVSAIAEELHVSESEIMRMDQCLASRDLSINAPARADGDVVGEWQDFLVEDSDNQEVTAIEADELDKRLSLMRTALGQLDRREQHILTQRQLKEHPSKLSELSAVYGISRERVRQIEVRAFEKLRRLMHDAAETNGMLN